MGINKRQQRETRQTGSRVACLPAPPCKGTFVSFCFVLFCFNPSALRYCSGEEEGKKETLQETQDRRSAVVLKPRSPRVQRVVFFSFLFSFLLLFPGAVCSFVGRGLIDKLYVHTYLLGSCMRWGEGEGEGERGRPPSLLLGLGHVDIYIWALYLHSQCIVHTENDEEPSTHHGQLCIPSTRPAALVLSCAFLLLEGWDPL